MTHKNTVFAALMHGWLLFLTPTISLHFVVLFASLHYSILQRSVKATWHILFCDLHTTPTTMRNVSIQRVCPVTQNKRCYSIASCTVYSEKGGYLTIPGRAAFNFYGGVTPTNRKTDERLPSNAGQGRIHRNQEQHFV